MACFKSLLDSVKVACRVASDAYDEELNDLIAAAFCDIGITDVVTGMLNERDADPLIVQAVKTYCRIHHPYDGMESGVLERLKASYDEQKAQLLMSSAYTNWGDGDA